MPIERFQLTAEQQLIRESVRRLCQQFPGEYWRELDAREGYPEEFVAALTRAGWLVAPIP